MEIDETRVIEAIELCSDLDFAEYKAACEILQRITERHLSPDIWKFVRAGNPTITFRDLKMIVF